MKTFLRWAKLSGSGATKIEILLRRGWRPGLPPALFLRRRRRQAEAAEAAMGREET